MVSFKTIVSFLAAAGLINAAPGVAHEAALDTRQSNPKLVFCHFMVKQPIFLSTSLLFATR